ncbi:MAG TPA: hypothetical protein VK753_01990 [Xanthomonadaceae bacterium]|nr:hypothetical protein [Xanthomonadaceae bacterium]
MSRRNLASRFPIAVLACLLQASPALAQSTVASQLSAISVEPSQASAALVAEALPAGSQLVVTAMKPVGEGVELSVETAGHVSIEGLKIGGDAARVAGLAVGVALSVTAVHAGWLITRGSETLAFIPDRHACALTHHREL